MYEIASERFILQTREGPGVSLFVNYDESYSFPRHVWVNVTYYEARPMSLKNATLMAQEFLAASSHGTENNDNVHQGDGEVQSSMDRAKKLLDRGSTGDASLGLFLLEDADIRSRDTDSLEMAIRIILYSSTEQKIFEGQ